MDKILIAHRSNTNGPNPNTENCPYFIEKAIEEGFDVEIDLRWYNEAFWLGHDKPQYQIDSKFLLNKKLWIHCKDIQSFGQLSIFSALRSVSINQLHVFMHNKDYALTTTGYVIAAPGKEVGPLSIAMMPEFVLDWDISQASGICSDYIEKYK